MKRRSHAQARDANEPEIVEALERVGCSVHRLAQPLDLLVGFRLKTYLIEVKDGSKPPSARPLTKDQREFVLTWRGGETFAVRCVREALCVVGAVWCGHRACGCGGVDDPQWFTEEREAEQARARAEKIRKRRMAKP